MKPRKQRLIEAIKTHINEGMFMIHDENLLKDVLFYLESGNYPEYNYDSNEYLYKCINNFYDFCRDFEA